MAVGGEGGRGRRSYITFILFHDLSAKANFYRRLRAYSPEEHASFNEAHTSIHNPPQQILNPARSSVKTNFSKAQIPAVHYNSKILPIFQHSSCRLFSPADRLSSLRSTAEN